MATEWEEQFPLSNVIALTRDISDHTPLLLNTGDSSSNSSQSRFKFELGWLLRDGFMDMVKEVWESVELGSTPMEFANTYGVGPRIQVVHLKRKRKIF